MIFFRSIVALLLASGAVAAESPNGDAQIRAHAGKSEIVITTSARFAGAIQSLTWDGVEFVNSADHGRELQSACSFDNSPTADAETYNPTEAGSRKDGAGPTSTSRLLEIEASGNHLRTRTQMAFWLAPSERSEGQLARNTNALSDYLLTKDVRIGFEGNFQTLDYNVTFTVPKNVKHTSAQFEALTSYLSAEFEKFWQFSSHTGKLEPLGDGPGEIKNPVVLATADGRHAMGIFALPQGQSATSGPSYGRWKFVAAKTVKWNCVFRMQEAAGIRTGDYSYQLLVSVGTLEEVESVLRTWIVPASASPQSHLAYRPGQPPNFWSVAVADTVMARWPDFTKAYFNSWTYMNGYELCGFEKLWRATGDKRYFDYAKRYIDECVDADVSFRYVVNAKGQTNKPSFNNLDNMMTGNTLVWLYEETKDARYKIAAEKIFRVLDNYPRNCDGGFWHNQRMVGQMWIDGIFMGQMFLMRYGKSIGDSDYCWDEVTKQITVFAKRAQRDETGLYLHAVYEAGHTNFGPRWADKTTGLAPEVWSEGLGWYALVVVEALADLPKSHPRRTEVEDIFRRLAAGLKKTQDAKTGRWFDVVDKGDQPNNWTDNSGSAMFTYALARGIELGLLDKAEYESVVKNGYRGIIENAKINEQGLVDIYSACDGEGVQVDYAHYINFKKSVNAKEAVAGFLWATIIVEKPELEKLRQP